MGESEYATGLEIGSQNAEEQVFIMYHGTTLKIARKIKRGGFIPSSDGMLGYGVYLSRSFEKACAYPRNVKPGKKTVILKVRVWVGKVKRIDRQRHPLQKSWHQAGYDTAWVPPNCGMVPSGLEEDCVWDPQRIQVLEILNKDGTKRNVFSYLPATTPYQVPTPMTPVAFGFSQRVAMGALYRPPSLGIYRPPSFGVSCTPSLMSPCVFRPF